MHPLYVSFFTVGTGYEAEAAELIKTLDAFGLPCDIAGVPSCGSWVKNCGHKPAFILGMMRKHRQPVVWLDADARVRQPPALFDTLNCDVAYHLKDGWELLSGTLYVGNTRAAESLVEDWLEGCRMSPAEWDQRVLQRIVESRAGLRVAELPAAYVQIFDSMAQGEPVIEHMQASRFLKLTA